MLRFMNNIQGNPKSLKSVHLCAVYKFYHYYQSQSYKDRTLRFCFSLPATILKNTHFCSSKQSKSKHKFQKKNLKSSYLQTKFSVSMIKITRKHSKRLTIILFYIAHKYILWVLFRWSFFFQLFYNIVYYSDN